MQCKPHPYFCFKKTCSQFWLPSVVLRYSNVLLLKECFLTNGPGLLLVVLLIVFSNAIVFLLSYFKWKSSVDLFLMFFSEW